MRSTLLLCALALVACDDDTTTTAAPPDLAARADLDTLVCTSDCPCATGLVCVNSDVLPEPFFSTCLQPCQTDADCGGRACVSMFGQTPRYCLAPDEPHTCGVHCDPGPRFTRCDGGNLVSVYVGLVCGDAYHHCPNGCVEDNPDGGADRQGRCL